MSAERGPYMTRNRAERIDARIDKLEASVNTCLDAVDDQVGRLSGLFVDLAKSQVQALFDATRQWAEQFSRPGSRT